MFYQLEWIHLMKLRHAINVPEVIISYKTLYIMYMYIVQRRPGNALTGSAQS